VWLHRWTGKELSYTPELEEEIEKRFQDDTRTLMYNFTLK
jgi:hypothetical protein